MEISGSVLVISWGLSYQSWNKEFKIGTTLLYFKIVSPLAAHSSLWFFIVCSWCKEHLPKYLYCKYFSNFSTEHLRNSYKLLRKLSFPKEGCLQMEAFHQDAPTPWILAASSAVVAGKASSTQVKIPMWYFGSCFQAMSGYNQINPGLNRHSAMKLIWGSQFNLSQSCEGNCVGQLENASLLVKSSVKTFQIVLIEHTMWEKRIVRMI